MFVLIHSVSKAACQKYHISYKVHTVEYILYTTVCTLYEQLQYILKKKEKYVIWSVV